MPSLYTQADKNIKKSWALLSLFLIFSILMGWLFSYILNNQFILYFAVIISIIQSFIAYWYSDKIVLLMTRAKPVKRETDPELYRILENLCIGAGLPVPKLYIIEEEQPNAFATGRNEKHAVVAVTRGLLNRLERAEIEGVIAHELAHIKNKDMLLQTLTVTLVGVIVILSDIFLRIALFFGGGSERDKRNIFFVVLALLAAILAPLAAQLIHFAISRKREFLADATGALITRYPEGLARALEKIAAFPHSMKVASNATAHLFIANPFRGQKISALFSTHPPIEERIKALREMSL